MGWLTIDYTMLTGKAVGNAIYRIFKYGNIR